ncbi:TPA: hypothetical protein RSS14_002824 [Klebsiella pneumoniae]|uniref:DUF6883 domain-containing protein n=1 Tax=Klebsiella pneumoniae TaxID=573 RepID=UPI001CBEDD91|nr:DUF6883 domain-containing protein [Klebsiella pneumoniae]EKX7637850.1 hypothetical protein [Klebsiella pneumoniae]ELA1308826.1 hypothetical protein [Klebsiella pneumoniae]MBZ1696782.1 hypothetical protein [Klebsiella pneumoniae]HDZ2531561.1 hypothetical protein [Klebsiella pneumoniae]HDZ2541968.1 hypothetical protein [Klebsiella pneumoniae]
MARKALGYDSFITFLFDADHPGLTKNYNYATPCQDEFLKIIASVDQSKSLHAGVRHGDVLIHNIASKPSKFIFHPRPSNPDISSWTAGSYQGKTDKRVLYTAINELKDHFSSTKTSINLELMWQKLLAHNIYSLSLYPVDLALASLIDDKFMSFSPYIGMAELDRYSYLHIRLFAELPDCGFFHHGTMFRALSIFDEKLDGFGSEGQSIIPIVYLPFIEYTEQAPSFPSRSNLSEQLEKLPNKLQTVMQDNHSERIAKELLSTFTSESETLFKIEFATQASDDDYLKVPVEKLINYALNMEHEKGKHKAFLFYQHLGIDSSQWRYLAYQLINESNGARILNITRTEHATKYETIVEVVGLNGNKCAVKAVWKISEGISQLITVYPEKKPQEAPKENTTPLHLIINEGDDENYWRNIFEAAHNEGVKSAQECIPEPMPWRSSFRESGGIESEGKCGYAYIILDGESDFAKWVLCNKYGNKIRGATDIEIHAKSGSQSIDREKAYAVSFSKILWLNGIDVRDITHVLT